MDNKIVQVDYVEVDNITYYTAVQVSEEVDEPVTTIRGWARDFEEELCIAKVNNRKCYTKEDIKRMKFIKELRRCEMSIGQIKIYLKKNGFRYAKYDSGLVNEKDPLGFQALASALSVEVDNKLNIFMEKLLEQVGEMNKKQLNDVSENLTEVMVETLDEKINDMKNEVAISLDSKLDERFVKTEQSLEEMLEELKQTKQEFKIASVSIESIINSENPPSIFEKFRKKYFK